MAAKYLMNQKTGMIVHWCEVQAAKKHMVDYNGPLPQSRAAAPNQVSIDPAPLVAAKGEAGDDLGSLKRADLFRICAAEGVEATSGTNVELVAAIRAHRANVAEADAGSKPDGDAE